MLARPSRAYYFTQAGLAVASSPCWAMMRFRHRFWQHQRCQCHQRTFLHKTHHNGVFRMAQEGAKIFGWVGPRRCKHVPSAETRVHAFDMEILYFGAIH